MGEFGASVLLTEADLRLEETLSTLDCLGRKGRDGTRYDGKGSDANDSDGNGILVSLAAVV